MSPRPVVSSPPPGNDRETHSTLSCKPRRKPKKSTSPSSVLPSTPNCEGADHSARASHRCPVSPLTPTVPNCEGADHSTLASQRHAVSPLTPICKALRELQAQRVATINQQRRIDNAARAFVRRLLGFRIDLPQPQRDAICKRAAAVLKAISKPPHNTAALFEEDVAIAKLAIPFVAASRQSRSTFDSFRKTIEQQQRELVTGLPAWRALSQIKGFAELGLAIIVGEAGDLADYPSPQHLWKRLGLAPRECYAMETKKGEIAFLIPRRRRSAIWTIGDALLKTNGKDGEYYQLYQQRKEYERQRQPSEEAMSKMHVHRRAQRFVEKRLLRVVWQAWRAQP